MNSSKELKNEIGTVDTIESITSVYQGIAALRMNQIRENVLKTKEFIDGVAEIYEHAKRDYIATLQKELNKAKTKDEVAGINFIKRNGKTLKVFLSANEHLYGSLIIDIWKKFAADVRKEPSEILVVGKFGKSLAEAEDFGQKVNYFDLADDNPSIEEIHKLITFVTDYERVIVFYGKVVTALTQEPDKSEITSGVTLERPVSSDKKYLFEPSAKEIIVFFEKEILAAFFNQKLLEHQLSRFSSRMVAMDQASQNAGILTKKLKSDLIHVRRRLQNVSQLEVFSGMSLWGGKKK